MPTHEPPALAIALDDGADDGVEAGAVAPAGQQADFHGGLPFDGASAARRATESGRAGITRESGRDAIRRRAP